MPSKEEIESSRIPTSLFLLSTILLRATTRTSLEEEALEDGHREDRDGTRQEVEALEDGEPVEPVEALEKRELVEDGEPVEAVEDGEPVEAVEAVEEGDREEGDREEGDREEGDREEGDREEGDREEGDREEDDIVVPNSLRKRGVTFTSSAPASAPALLPRSPASSPGPESKQPRGLREPLALSARVTRLQTARDAAIAAREAAIAAEVIPSASAPILSPRTEAKPRFSPTSRSTRSSSLPSVREESKLEEVLNYLDNKVFTDEGIKEILRAIDNIIDSHNLSNEDDLNKLSQTLEQQHGIIITPETININISSKK
jgi:hypothetical protein